jgi:glycosyltransferase involved in cell wall biosynthesis
MRDRPELIRLAIISFLNQTYQNKELLIVDDSVLPLKLEILKHPQIRYHRVPRGKPPMLTGCIRNLCCELAKGDVISHFDSDDWYHPLRLEEHVAHLKDGIQVVGCHIAQFYDVDKKRAFELRTGEVSLGTSQIYFKSYWEGHKFARQRFKEDVGFSNQAEKLGVLKMISGIGRIVVRRHSKNSWGAGTRIDNNPDAWRDIALTDLPKEFWEDMEACRKL